jgi:hypothetical protein
MHEEAIAAAASSSSKLTNTDIIHVANANTPHQSNATIDHHFGQIESFDAADMPNQIVTSQTKIIISHEAAAELKNCGGDVSSIVINDSNALFVNTSSDDKSITSFIQLEQKELELSEMLTDNDKASEDGKHHHGNAATRLLIADALLLQLFRDNFYTKSKKR